jgi:hypothetical protein
VGALTALAVIAPAGTDATAAQAATAPPGIVVLNGAPGRLTSYPVAANGEAPRTVAGPASCGSAPPPPAQVAWQPFVEGVLGLSYNRAGNQASANCGLLPRP